MMLANALNTHHCIVFFSPNNHPSLQSSLFVFFCNFHGSNYTILRPLTLLWGWGELGRCVCVCNSESGFLTIRVLPRRCPKRMKKEAKWAMSVVERGWRGC